MVMPFSELDSLAPVCLSPGYDDLGQVTSGKRRWADGSAVAGQDFSYGFDTAGNRVQTTANGRAAVWTPNALNQYASREVPCAVDVIGTVDAAATVTVNGAAPTRQQAGYYHREIAAANASDPVYLPIVVEAEREGPSRARRSCSKPPEQFTYDADGNLTSDGRWTPLHFCVQRDMHVYMRTTIDMPDGLMHRVKKIAAERRTTFRALVVDALERTLDEKPRVFKLRDTCVGAPTGVGNIVSSEAINQAVDEQRESRFVL